MFPWPTRSAMLSVHPIKSTPPDDPAADRGAATWLRVLAGNPISSRRANGLTAAHAANGVSAFSRSLARQTNRFVSSLRSCGKCTRSEGVYGRLSVSFPEKRADVAPGSCKSCGMNMGLSEATLRIDSEVYCRRKQKRGGTHQPRAQLFRAVVFILRFKICGDL